MQHTIQEAMGRVGHPGNSAANNFKRLDPPFFDGSEDAIAADAWLQDIEVILEAARIPEEEKVAVVCLQLVDLARSWWAMLAVDLATPVAWAVFCEKFQTKYFD
ncbi:hypothetical protein ACDT16_13680, partial [Staphylococcus aureus]